MLWGRDRELAEVSVCVRREHPVVLLGEAGVGKSTLARAAFGERPDVLVAGALATMAWSPLLMFRRLLGQDLPDRPEDVASLVIKRAGGGLILDDLQWADDASLEVARHLLGSLTLIVTVRTSEPRSTEITELLEALGVRCLHLAGIDDRWAHEMVARTHPSLTPAEREGLVERAGGNPLLLQELPRGAAGAPGLVSAMVGRLDGLSAQARSAVRRLAVLGRPVDRMSLRGGVEELLRAGLVLVQAGTIRIVHPLMAEAIVEALGGEADALRRALVEEVPGAEGAYLLAAAGDRAGARALALEAAEHVDRRTLAELLALAARCAEPGDLDARNRVAAARLFSGLGQPARAAELCAPEGRDALPPLERGALCAAAAEAAWLQGHEEACLGLLEQAMEDVRGTRSDVEVLVLAGSTIADTRLQLDGRPALDRARAAVQLADELGLEQGYARLRLASVLLTSGETGWAELYRAVIADAEAEGDDLLRRNVLTSLMLGLWVTGDLVAAEKIARDEMSRVPVNPPDGVWLTFVAHAAVLGLFLGRSRTAMVDEFLPILQAEPRFRDRELLVASVVIALADAGRHQESARLSSDAVDRVETDPRRRSIAHWARAEAAWLAGRYEEAASMNAAIVELGLGDYPSALLARLVSSHATVRLGLPLIGPQPGVSLPAWAAIPSEWSGLLAAGSGDHPAAIHHFDRAADLWADVDVRGQVRCAWAAAEASVAAGHDDAVSRLEGAEDLTTLHGLDAMRTRVHQSLRRAGATRRRSARAGFGGLTGSEVMVLELVGDGLSSADIGAAQGIETSTVNSFIRSATAKLGAPTRVAAAARLVALRRGEPVHRHQ